MRKRIAIWVAMLMIIASIPAYAASDAAEYIDISVNGTEYLKVTPETEVIVGDIDLENADIRILTLNGNKLENVGTKSGFLTTRAEPCSRQESTSRATATGLYI